MRLKVKNLRRFIFEALDDDGIDSELLRKARNNSFGAIPIIKSDRHGHFSKRGHKQDLVDEMEELFRLWGLGGGAQETARVKILDAVDNHTPLGKVIRDHSRLETRLWEEWIDGSVERGQKRFKEMMIDLEDGTGVTLFEGQYYKSDLDDGTITLQDIKDEAGTEKVMDVKLYRAGKLGGRLESWTQNSGGAVINNHSGQTFSGKLHERCWIDLKKEGYSILAGPTRMMGSPGESEITLIKLDKS